MAFSSQPESKPTYDFVPLPDRVELAKPAGHDKFKPELLSGRLRGELVALTPVHVASGNIELTTSEKIPLVKAHFTTRGKTAIPGSSLKGAVRSMVEAVTRSCLAVRSLALQKLLPLKFKPCQIGDRDSLLCPACRMFGALGYHGQVKFADAVLLEGRVGAMFSPSLFRVNPDSNVYYDGNGRVKGRKFYFHGQPVKGNVPLEVCDVKSRFLLQVDFVNLTEAELGVLLTALGQAKPSFAIKLGGAKPACCGSVEVRIQSAEVHDNAHSAFNYEASSIEANPAQWIEAAETLLVRANVEILHGILIPGGKRPGPS